MNKNQTSSQINSTSNVTQRILSMDSNRMRLIFAQIILFSFVTTILIIFSVPTYIFSYTNENGELMTNDLIAGVSGLFLILSILALLPPLLHGYSCFSTKLSSGEHPEITEIFSPFLSVKKYFSSFSLFFIRIIRLSIIALPTVGGVSFMLTWSTNALEVIFLIFCILTVTYVSVYISSYLFFAPYFIVRGMKFTKAVRCSFSTCNSKRSDIVMLELSHIPSILAGIFSFGILALIHTIPRISVSYNVFCDQELIRKGTTAEETEEIKNEG